MDWLVEKQKDNMRETIGKPESYTAKPLREKIRVILRDAHDSPLSLALEEQLIDSVLDACGIGCTGADAVMG